MANILIIDDSPTYQAGMRQMLKRYGHRCMSEYSGEAGITRAIAIQPDLILMDIIMPGMNGFQATRRLTRLPATGHIPIIIVSTEDQATERKWGLRQGARDYLTKPVVELDLIRTINMVLKQAA